MTYKHISFEDSVVMRSMEKLAREKGLVSADAVVKTAASNEVDLMPSKNLMDNILRLCAGLRQQGFSKYADELESKYVNYKQAQTLYETSKETGEDLVDAAHPEGSHKLEDVDSNEAVVETIFDQHLKNMSVIDKMPTGKLASSKDILNAVKVVLAKEETDSKKALAQALPVIPELVVPTAAATKAVAQGGAWARLISLLGTEVAGTGTAAGAAGTLLAAELAGAIAGAYAGSKYFDWRYEAQELIEAGDRVVSEAEDIISNKTESLIDATNAKASKTLDTFKTSLASIKSQYPVISKLKEDPHSIKMADLQALAQLSNSINASAKLALSLFMFARNKEEDQFLGRFRGSGDLVLVANNYMKVANQYVSALDQFANNVTKALQEKTGKETQSKFDADVKAIIDKINNYKNVVNGKKSLTEEQKSSSIKWLDGRLNLLNNLGASQNKQDDLNKINARITEFGAQLDKVK